MHAWRKFPPADHITGGFYMTKIDIISGFLGAGKTTLIKKLISQAFQGEKLVLIENEFGEIGVDGGFLKDAGIEITEMNSGCICCSLVGDFGAALEKVLTQFNPDRILIEPSGVGKLSDVIRAVQGVAEKVPVELNSFVTVVDATKCKIYMKNFGEFFNNQVESANTIILSRTQKMDEAKLEAVVAMLREHNDKAAIITTPWDSLSGAQIREAMEKGHKLADEMLAAVIAAHLEEDEEECDDPDCECHHHHHDHDEEHEHHHHHDHDEECECGCHDHDHEEHEHHHHHDHDEECECGCHDHDHEEHEHHHHHDHDEECECGCHDHDHDEHEHHHHHHHHHADEVFTSWGMETPHKYDKETLDKILAELSDSDSTSYGTILRAKGMLPAADGTWLYFDLTPDEYEIRQGSPEYTGRLCVIGSQLQEEKLAQLFQLA
jgi:G3E family GTPase